MHPWSIRGSPSPRNFECRRLFSRVTCRINMGVGIYPLNNICWPPHCSGFSPVFSPSLGPYPLADGRSLLTARESASVFHSHAILSSLPYRPSPAFFRRVDNPSQCRCSRIGVGASFHCLRFNYRTNNMSYDQVMINFAWN
jgi:hypothetical protein